MSVIGTTKNDRLAHELWGAAYNEIPKSVFAAVVWHLANLASGTADMKGAAELRFLEEWAALEPHGISKPTSKVLRCIRSARS